MQRTLANTAFSLEQCVEFGRVSRDWNPLHVDPVYARRSIAGGCAVHGTLILLTALELAFGAGVSRPTRIQAHFRKFVAFGDEVAFALLDENVGAAQTLEVRATVDGKAIADVVLHFAPIPQHTLPEAIDRDAQAFRSTPLELQPHLLLGNAHAIDLHAYEQMRAFPRCAETLGELATRALCASTYFVGMVCPGLNSIYSSLDVALPERARDKALQTFTLDAYDDRVGRFDIAARGPIDGRLVAFGRPALVTSEHISAYAQRVGADEFARIDALVIGGSRGLGAAAAKILALGGARVALTFALGASDAAGVASEIEGTAGRSVPARRFDMNHDAFASLAADLGAANAVFMFATPRIRQGGAKALDRKLFDSYFGAYVEKLWELCSFIESQRRAKKVVYVPSSTFVESGSKGFLEYAMAKAAVEALAADVNASFRYVRVVTSRLPQLKTDQTASRFEVGYGSTFDILYAMLKTVAAKVDG